MFTGCNRGANWLQFADLLKHLAIVFLPYEYKAITDSLNVVLESLNPDYMHDI